MVGVLPSLYRFPITPKSFPSAFLMGVGLWMMPISFFLEMKRSAATLSDIGVGFKNLTLLCGPINPLRGNKGGGL
jgi:hypothetical protein